MNLNSKEYKIKRLLELSFYFIFFPISILLFILIILANIFYRVKWFPITSSRIGHFISEPLIYFSEIKLFSKKEFIICYNRSFVCNDFVGELLKRQFFFLPHFIMHPLHRTCIFFEKFFPHLNKLYVSDTDTRLGRDINFALQKSYKPLELKPDEIIKGNSILKKLGYKKQKIVLLLVRDDFYLKKEFNNYDKKWNYHSFRDWDINTFKKSVEYLISKGYFVVRISKFAKEKLLLNNENFIDLPFSEYRSDFFEIFLSYKCSFCYGTDTGSIHMPITIFQKPFCGFFVPLNDIHSYLSNSLMATKRFFYKDSAKELNLKEIINLDLHKNIKPKNINHNIIIKDLEENEILEICKEFILRLNRKWVDTSLDIDLQNKFWKYFFNFQKGNNNIKKHGEISTIKFSAKFLRNNQKWLD